MRKKLKPLEYAFYLLKLRDRSIGEMEEKLCHREYLKEDISRTLAFLIEKDFLNDQRFAENFVRFKKTLKPVGKYYLQNKLMVKKIPKEIIDKVLRESGDQISEISEAVDRWLSHHKKLPKEKIYQNLARHLVARGFEWEKIRETIAEKIQMM